MPTYNIFFATFTLKLQKIPALLAELDAIRRLFEGLTLLGHPV